MFCVFTCRNDEVIAAVGLDFDPAVSAVAERLFSGKVISKKEAQYVKRSQFSLCCSDQSGEQTSHGGVSFTVNSLRETKQREEKTGLKPSHGFTCLQARRSCSATRACINVPFRRNAATHNASLKKHKETLQWSS